MTGLRPNFQGPVLVPERPPHLAAFLFRNVILKGNALRIVFCKSFFRGVRSGEHFDVLDVTDLLCGFDIDKNGHRLVLYRFKHGHALPLHAMRSRQKNGGQAMVQAGTISMKARIMHARAVAGAGGTCRGVPRDSCGCSVMGPWTGSTAGRCFNTDGSRDAAD